MQIFSGEMKQGVIAINCDWSISEALYIFLSLPRWWGGQGKGGCLGVALELNKNSSLKVSAQDIYNSEFD